MALYKVHIWDFPVRRLRQALLKSKKASLPNLDWDYPNHIEVLRASF
jgi:hypothetical protein